jgi:hypothetical protein
MIVVAEQPRITPLKRRKPGAIRGNKGLSKEELAAWHHQRGPLVVGIPCLPFIHRPAFKAFLFIAKHLREDDDLIVADETAIVTEARNKIIQTFLDGFSERHEYLLLFDDDMTPKVNTPDLLSWRQADFVSGLCVRKTAPFTPIPVARAENPAHPRGYEYRVIADLEPNSGVRKAHGTGGACLCLSRELLKRIEPPWFEFRDGLGEDLVFCEKVREAGGIIWIDTHIMPGHIGTIDATFDTWLPFREHYAREYPESEIAITH